MFVLQGKYSGNIANSPEHVRINVERINEYGSRQYVSLPQNHELASLARELVQNNPLAHGAINALIGTILGTGIKIYIDKFTRQETAKAVSAFLPWVDHNMEMSIREFLTDVLYPYLVDGEVFVIEFKKNQYSIITTEDCPLHLTNFQKKVKHGIKYTSKSLRRPQYHDISGYIFYADIINHESERNYIFIPKNIIKHIFNKDSTGSHRGITPLHAAFQTFHAIDSIIKNELESTRIASVLLGQVVKDIDTPVPETKEEDFKTDNKNTHTLGNKPIMFNNLPPGHKIELVTTNNRGHGQLEEFLNSQMRLLGRTLGLPTSLITGLYDSNFSSERKAAIDAALGVIATHRARLVKIINHIFYRYLTSKFNTKIQFHLMFNDLPVIDEYKHAQAERIKTELILNLPQEQYVTIKF